MVYGISCRCSSQQRVSVSGFLIGYRISDSKKLLFQVPWSMVGVPGPRSQIPDPRVPSSEFRGPSTEPIVRAYNDLRTVICNEKLRRNNEKRGIRDKRTNMRIIM